MTENYDYGIVEAFSDSLKSEIISITSDLGDLALDSFLESDIVKDIPILNTVVSVYKIGRGIGDAFYLKKLAAFINQLNNGAASEKTLEKHKSLILSDPDKFKKEIEYILILINRYIDSAKSMYLAKLYLAYLDGKINWIAFMKYSQVMDQIFISDLEPLFLKGVLTTKRSVSDDVLRLSALGLLVEVNNAPKIEMNKYTGDLYMNTTHEADEVEYAITDFGAVLAEILK